MAASDPKEVQNEEEQPNFGLIVVRFHQQGSVFFDLDSEGTFPLQMIAIGEYLSTLGKNSLLKEQARAEMEASQQKIQVPNPKINPAGLTKATKK